MDKILVGKNRTYGAIFTVMLLILMTLSVFLQYKEKSLTALKLKVIYSELSQVLTTSIGENGRPSSWNIQKGYKNIDTFNDKIFKYFSIDEQCIDKPGNCTPETNYRSIKRKQTNINLKDIPAITLKNGITIAVEAVSSCQNENQVCANIFVDINGTDEPNAIGKDLFLFKLKNTNNGYLETFGENLPVEKLKTDEIYGCSKQSTTAFYCTALIKKNNWRIKSNYPW